MECSDCFEGGTDGLKRGCADCVKLTALEAQLARAVELLRAVRLLLVKVIEEENRAHLRKEQPLSRVGEMRMYADHSIPAFLAEVEGEGKPPFEVSNDKVTWTKVSDLRPATWNTYRYMRGKP